MTETRLTKEQMESVAAETKKMMDAIADGKSSRDVMAQIYLDGFSGKTLEQAYAAADAVIDTTEAFDKKYFEAKNDLDGVLQSFQKQVDEGKTPAERCTYWRQFTAAISAAALEANGEGTRLTEEQLDALRVSEEEATAEYEAELHAQAIEAIKNSSLMLLGIMNHAEAVEQAAASGAAELVVDLGTEDVNYRAIVSMLVYTKAKNGELEGIPADTTLEQTTALVCAEIEQERIMDEVGKGNMTAEDAIYVLKCVGITFAIVAGVIVIAEVFHVAELLCAAVFGFMIGCWILDTISNAIAFWKENAGKIIKAAVCAVKTVVNGAKKIAAYVYEHVIKKAIDKCKQLLAAVKEAANGTSKGETVRRAEVVPAQ